MEIGYGDGEGDGGGEGEGERDGGRSRSRSRSREEEESKDANLRELRGRQVLVFRLEEVEEAGNVLVLLGLRELGDALDEEGEL